MNVACFESWDSRGCINIVKWITFPKLQQAYTWGVAIKTCMNKLYECEKRVNADLLQCCIFCIHEFVRLRWDHRLDGAYRNNMHSIENLSKYSAILKQFWMFLQCCIFWLLGSSMLHPHRQMNQSRHPHPHSPHCRSTSSNGSNYNNLQHQYRKRSIFEQNRATLYVFELKGPWACNSSFEKEQTQSVNNEILQRSVFWIPMPWGLQFVDWQCAAQAASPCYAFCEISRLITKHKSCGSWFAGLCDVFIAWLDCR